MRRGDLLTVVIAGDYGKPRPAIVVQTDSLRGLESVIICPLTTDVQDAAFRVIVEPDEINGLEQRSQVMVEKLTALSLRRCGRVIGRVSPDVMLQVDDALAAVVGLAD